MAAYMVVEIVEMIDPERFSEYREEVGPILAEFGARMIARGDEIDLLDGDG